MGRDARLLVVPGTSAQAVVTGAGGHAQRRWVLALTSVASFMVGLDALVVTTALPALARELHAGVGALQWTVNAYAVPCGAGIVAAAALGDRLGRRRVFVAGLALFTLASAGCALAPGTGWLLGARALQGLGAAAVLPLGLTVLTGAFPAERRGAILGIWGGLGGLAVAAGPLVGGTLTQVWSWQAIFWLNVPVGLAAVALSARRLPESRGVPVPVDWAGVLLLGTSVAAWLAGLVHAGTAGWGGGTVALLGTGALVLGVFVFRERRAARPMLPPGLFRVPGFPAGAISGLLSAASVNGAAFLVPQFFQTALGRTPLATGLLLLPWTAAPLLLAPAAGALADRAGRGRVLVAGLLAQGGGLAWFALAAHLRVAYGALVAPLALAGAGIAMVVPVVAATALHRVAPTELGAASGALTTLQRLGGALGVALVATVVAARGRPGAAEGLLTGFRPALAVVALLSLMAAGTAALLLARHSRARLPGDPLRFVARADAPHPSTAAVPSPAVPVR